NTPAKVAPRYVAYRLYPRRAISQYRRGTAKIDSDPTVGAVDTALRTRSPPSRRSRQSLLLYRSRDGSLGLDTSSHRSCHRRGAPGAEPRPTCPKGTAPCDSQKSSNQPLDFMWKGDRVSGRIGIVSGKEKRDGEDHRGVCRRYVWNSHAGR